MWWNCMIVQDQQPESIDLCLRFSSSLGMGQLNHNLINGDRISVPENLQ